MTANPDVIRAEDMLIIQVARLASVQNQAGMLEQVKAEYDKAYAEVDHA